MRLIDADYLVNKFIRNCPIEEGGIPLKDFDTHQKILKLYPTVNAMVLPCKLGDSVYIIVNLKGGIPSHIVERKCTGIHITEKVFGHRSEKASRYLVTNSDIGFAQHIPFTQFGKTVFFSRKEAEAALAKMKG